MSNIFIPTREPRTAATTHGAQEADLSPSGHRQLRILLLEDVATDAELIQRELRKSLISFSCRCVETRDDYLRFLQEFSPDIVLSDYSMPRFNAMEALHLLKDSPYDIPFILVTGSQSEEVAVACMKEGVDDYVLKTTLKRLPSALVNAIKKKEAMLERTRAIEAMQRSEEHFRSLIENALDIIAILNPDGTFRYASPSLRGLGYKPESLYGRSLFEFVGGDDSREVSEVLSSVFSTPGQPRTVEFLFRHQDGSWRVLEAFVKSINADAKTAGIVINARDVSDRKHAEAAIEKLAAFPRLNPNPVFELAADGRLTYYNQAAAEMARSVEKPHPVEILPVETPQIVQECLTTGQRNSGIETHISGRILSWSFFPIIPSQVVHCYAVDITERLNLEAQLRQSQKMESIGQLAAGVAHDFNNILTIIQGYSGLLLARETLEETVREPLKQVANASERAANLTRQLLMFSRKQILQPSELNLNEVIANISQLLRRILGADIALEMDYDTDLPKINGDPGMVEQVVMNLAVNARDAMPRGGSLRITTTLENIGEEQVQKNPEARRGEYVCVRVSDTGSGIPAKILSRIFEPFFTTKEVGKGTGLGLATVYGIAKQHQGWIEVASEVGKGTSFRVFFPCRTGTQTPSHSGTAAEEELRGGEERVLVVEDEPELRALVSNVLQRFGYTVFAAVSGPDALPLWQRHKEEIDLLLTDMVMPGGMTGRELAQRLKREKPSLRVIYTSGYSVEMVDKDFGLKRGLNFIQKPYQPQTLVRMVRECLDAQKVKATAVEKKS